jgi:alkanesulfonate monooxygenase SsuD/methylene tetrahydromethanopterin reductase-like flavin-dependent oxidoreductase (luciferase family)
MLFGMRFDFRNPDISGTAMADRYAAALEMAEWGERLGCVTFGVSEHHGCDDGYLPSPLMFLAAVAARTTTLPMMVGALIAPFHDPLRLAEDLVVLDNLSRGRVDLIVAGGYVHEEFEMFDVPMNERAKRVTEAVKTLKAAFTGEPFEFRGRTVQITPKPYREGGPSIILGGSSEPAARRAARIADGFVPSVPAVWEYYRDEVQVLGRPDPGPSPMGDTVTVALAENAEEGWEKMAPFFLHETNAYGVWKEAENVASPFRTIADVDELRGSGLYRVVTPEEFIDEQKSLPFAFANFHPMCGGMPVDLAWSSLNLFEQKVLPAFA